MADWPYNTQRWQRLRKAHLSIEPLCRGCKPRLVQANTVDHVVPTSAGGPAFPGHDGLASYCAPCHNRKTARGSEAGAVRTRKPMKGCDVDGNPLDSNHPWHAQARHAGFGTCLSNHPRRSVDGPNGLDGVGYGHRCGDRLSDGDRVDGSSREDAEPHDAGRSDAGMAKQAGQRPDEKSLRPDTLGPTPTPNSQLVSKRGRADG